ncbi:50S ribosomal protein L23 [Candidatus Roizmanbacteria bacterium]|nr:50S ribosomal protein L23 [Candidatus Roizmanbacteria bacterium]
MEINKVLIRPIITEKATNLSKGQVYSFEVHRDANKFQVKKALEQLYKVKVGRVNVTVRKGKKRRVGKRMTSKELPDKKIAFVSLREGKIDLFPQT